MLQITLPDKSTRDFKSSLTIEELAADIGPGLAKATVAGKINGKLVDASEAILEDSEVEIITAKDAEGSIGGACTTSTTYTITIDSGSSLVDTNSRLVETESKKLSGVYRRQ